MLSFSISYWDLTKFPYFVDTTEREGDRGWNEAQREGKDRVTLRITLISTQNGQPMINFLHDNWFCWTGEKFLLPFQWRWIWGEGQEVNSWSEPAPTGDTDTFTPSLQVTSHLQVKNNEKSFCNLSFYKHCSHVENFLLVSSWHVMVMWHVVHKLQDIIKW
jgi:hypothetical protein